MKTIAVSPRLFLTCCSSLAIIIIVFHAKTNLKVGVREAVHSTRSVKSHAYSHRICAFTAQKDSSGCGARRMANLYRSLNRSIPVERERV